MSTFVTEHVFEGVEGEETDSGFEGVAGDEGRAANIVLFAEGRERLLQGIGKGAVQLETGLREFSGVLVGQSIADKVLPLQRLQYRQQCLQQLLTVMDLVSMSSVLFTEGMVLTLLSLDIGVVFRILRKS